MKKLIRYLLMFILIAVVYYGYTTYPKLDIISGFSSKSVASHLFLAGRNAEMTELEDNNVPSMNMANNEVNEMEKSVTSKAMGFKSRKAIYRDGVGVVLLPADAIIKQSTYQKPNRTQPFIDAPYPFGDLEQKDSVFMNVNYKRMEKAVNAAFEDTDSIIQKTRSVLVIYKDQIIAENYKEGFDKNSLFLGWSMTKSVTSAVLGVMERQGKITLTDNHLFNEWLDDDRKDIKISNLLNMNSGLEWEEDYTKICDVTRMLFIEPDMSRVQLEKKLVGTPDNSWNYSSGTSNMLSGFIRSKFKSHQEYLNYWYSDLIDKIGMYSMLIETDYSGNYVGSSYAWATARDWGKFGLLYLKKGNWNGEQILNPSWVDFSKTPTNGSDGVYGGHFWLNAGGKYPDVPRDLFSCNGYQGQYVFIIPSKDLVVVRTGLMEYPDFDVNGFLKEIVESIE